MPAGSPSPPHIFVWALASFVSTATQAKNRTSTFKEPLQIDQLFEHRHLMVAFHCVDLVDASFVAEVLKTSLMGWGCIGFSTRLILTC